MKEKENNIKSNLFLKKLYFIEEFMINISENGTLYLIIGCPNGLKILNKTLLPENKLSINLLIDFLINKTQPKKIIITRIFDNKELFN